MEGLLKSQNVPTFEGKKEKFALWSFSFLSICQIPGCKQVLTSDSYVVPDETDVLDPVTDAAAILARKANDTAYGLLTISVKDETGFQALRNGITDELPSGSARHAWKNIISIYQPKSKTQQYELEQRFNDCKLEKESKNPEEWFTELEHIKVQLKENHTVILDDDKTIQHIVYNLKPKC
jgi:gag-polypeptide of LTR copia-type